MAGDVSVLVASKRTQLMWLATSCVGAIGFAWPFFIHGHGELAGSHAGDAPWLLFILLPMMIAMVMGEMAAGTLDARAVAVLGILAACDAALRIPSPGVAGFEPMWLLIICAGRVFGRSFGFTLGMTTLFVSALVTGGVGPWLPFQMLAAGWVGAGAAMLPRAKGAKEIGVLVVYSAIASLFYGALTNLWFWPFVTGSTTAVSFVPGASVIDNLHHFVLYDLTTSLGFDLPRAATTIVLMAVFGAPVLAALRRTSRKASFGAEVTFSNPTTPSSSEVGSLPA